MKMEWLLLLLLLPLGYWLIYKVMEAFDLVTPSEAWAEEKRREKRWEAMQKELEQQNNDSGERL